MAETKPVIHNWVTFIKGHQTLFLGAVAAVLIWKCWGGWLSYTIDKARKESDTATQALVAQHQKDTDKETNLIAQINDLKATIVQQQTLAAQLEQGIQARDAQLSKTLAEIQTAPITSVVENWEALIPNVTAAEFTTNSGGTVTVSGNVTRATVTALTELPAAQADRDNWKQVADSKDIIITKQADSITNSNTLIAGLHNELDAQAKACTAQVNLIKTEAKKSKRSWFLRGLSIGGGIVAFILK
jgi:hypothetical protein